MTSSADTPANVAGSVGLTPNKRPDIARVTTRGRTAAEDPEPVMVILFAEDPALWHQGFVQYGRRTAWPPPSGGQRDPDVMRLDMIRMVPTRYLVIAVRTDFEVPNPGDPRVLERLRPLAVPVTLVAGQSAKVALTVVDVTQ